ncbi:MAG TPA: endonuclease VII domain-containing protein [Acidimicrobiales bacterium]|nr:endonuclease VII domain-containing protein [Acidimicrobiales bacterium]
MDKRCRDCGEVKPVEDFYRHEGCRDGFRPECKACNLAEKARKHRENPEPARVRTRTWQEDNPDRYRENQRTFRESGGKKRSDRRSYLKRKYGISLEDYDAMLEAQDGRCAICGRLPRDDISLHVDHHHDSGRLRGLLCFPCNVTVGLIREDRDRLRSIADYLASHDPEAQETVERAKARLRAVPPPTWEQSA